MNDLLRKCPEIGCYDNLIGFRFEKFVTGDIDE